MCIRAGFAPSPADINGGVALTGEGAISTAANLCLSSEFNAL
jgi:hypothetical protein